MYKIQNGILEQDGRRVLALGQSYYPSFHASKFPVPPDGDHIGEMKKDLRDFKDVAMVDENGTAQDMTVWCDFIQTTFHHEGILEDNVTHAKGLSRHYAQYPNVVGFQIYNEPHYPRGGIFDYHPKAIAAYRRWLVKNEIMTAKEAAGLPTYTCSTTNQAAKTNVYRGCDFFANARSMDIVGCTCYYKAMGAEYYSETLNGDMARRLPRAGRAPSQQLRPAQLRRHQDRQLRQRRLRRGLSA